ALSGSQTKAPGSAGGYLLTAEEGTFSEVVKSVKEVCQYPSDQGAHWQVKIHGDGKAKVKLIGSASGEAEFSKSEWSGVQQVLKEHQKDDSKNYRACARELTPLFLKKFSSDGAGRGNEPTRDEMLSALQAKFAAINQHYNDLLTKCEQRQFENDPIRAMQCLQLYIVKPSQGSLAFKIEEFEKIGCEPASGQPGFICDYVFAASANSPFMKGAIGEILGSGNLGQGRFVSQDNGWLFLPVNSSDS
ncbi:MAG: hypothetical protein ABTR54_07115, partial [Candidatus Competibacter sp.]